MTVYALWSTEGICKPDVSTSLAEIESSLYNHLRAKYDRNNAVYEEWAEAQREYGLSFDFETWLKKIVIERQEGFGYAISEYNVNEPEDEAEYCRECEEFDLYDYSDEGYDPYMGCYTGDC